MEWRKRNWIQGVYITLSPKNLLDKIAETGSIIWNGIRKKRVFPHLDSSKMSRITICKVVEIIL